MAKDYEKMAEQILKYVGGEENISLFTHCITRLRFNVKDQGLVKTEELKNIEGVMGVRWTGGQLQLIIGQDVGQLYSVVCNISGLHEEKPVDENLDADTKGGKFSLKKLGNNIIGYISPIMFGILPVMIGASMCKTLAVVLGPGVLNLIGEESDLYVLLNLLYNAFFYFLPLYLGYLAAKQLKINELMGIFMGAMIIVPDFIDMVGVRETFNIYGISAPVADYSQTFLPVILGVWICSYVYKFLDKHIPKAISTIFVPTLTMLIMAPVMFIVCAPLGTYLGDIIGNVLITMANANVVISVISYVLLAVLFPYIVLGGMHMVLINFAIMTYTLNGGFETFVLPVSFAYSFAVYGVALGAALKVKDKEQKAMAMSYVATGLLAGVSEPILYGVVLKYKRAIPALAIGCAAGGLFCALFKPHIYIAGSLMNVFSAVPNFVGGGTANIVEGMVLMVLSFALAAIAGYIMIDTKEV